MHACLHCMPNYRSAQHTADAATATATATATAARKEISEGFDGPDELFWLDFEGSSVFLQPEIS